DKAKDFVWSDASESDGPKGLVGKIGVAQTEFLPHGTALIDQREYEAVSEAGPIEPGTTVRVTKLDVGRLVVIPWKTRLGSGVPMSSESSLDRPSDELGLDSLQYWLLPWFAFLFAREPCFHQFLVAGLEGTDVVAIFLEDLGGS
ncbi:MAG: NfeD family protein, partial [Pirellula sp.]